jgi:hypothetical protein
MNRRVVVSYSKNMKKTIALWETISFLTASYATREAFLAHGGRRADDDRFAVWLFFASCLWTYFFFPLCILFIYRAGDARKKEDDDIVLV